MSYFGRQVTIAQYSSPDDRLTSSRHVIILNHDYLCIIAVSYPVTALAGQKRSQPRIT